MMFEDFVNIVETQKPYRARPNEYPLYKRSHGFKYFKPDGYDKFVIYCQGKEIGVMHRGDLFEWTRGNMDLYSTDITVLNQTIFDRWGYIYWCRAKLGFIWRVYKDNGKDSYLDSNNNEYHVSQHMKLDLANQKPCPKSYYSIHVSRIDKKREYQIRLKYKDDIILAKQWLQNTDREALKQDCDSIRKDMMDTIQTNVFEDMEKVLSKLSPYEQVLFLIIKNGRSGLIQFDDYTTEDVTNQGLIYLRKYFYEKEGIYDDEIIPWSEGRIPRNKNLRVKFEANRLNTNQTV